MGVCVRAPAKKNFGHIGSDAAFSKELAGHVAGKVTAVTRANKFLPLVRIAATVSDLPIFRAHQELVKLGLVIPSLLVRKA